jgi:hypothetical protein
MKQNLNLQRVLLSLFFLPVFLSLFNAFGNRVHVVHPSNANRSVKYSQLTYGQLKLCELGLSERAFEHAITGFQKLVDRGAIENTSIITIIDFTKSSAEKRMFVIDLQSNEVLFHTYVAHGQHSGKDYAKYFSNVPSSYQSSLGFYRTTKTYMGKNGYSLQLKGLETGINDKAEDRAIVMHGAPYVSESLIRSQGFIGRSWGCPAVAQELAKPIIDKIKNGSCLFIYAENPQYYSHTRILRS